MSDTFSRRERPFVGRKDLIAAFIDAVNNKKPDEHKILVYHGVAGIGKSALREELARELDKLDPDAKSALLDFELPSYRDMETALFHLRQELKSKCKIDFRAFDIGYAVYWRKIKPQIPLNQESFRLWDETGLLADLIKETGDIPVIGLIQKIVKIVDKADKRVSDWFTKRGSTLLQDLPSMEAKNIEKIIPVLFAEDLNTYTEEYGYKTVVFIDTYEQLWGKDRTEGNRFTKDEWIRGIVERTPGILWTIGGREKLEWPKLDKVWEDRIESLCVEDLEEGYAHEYLTRCGIENEDIRKAIFEGSKGVPFYLDISVNTFERIKEKGKEPSVGDFGKTQRDVLDRFIRNLNDNEIETLRVLSAARFWDKDIFIATVKEFGTGYPPTKIEDFHRFSFIKERAGDNTWTMHELMRVSLIEHTEDKELLKNASIFLFNHYNAQLEDIEPKNITETHKTAFGEAYYHAKQCLNTKKLNDWFWDKVVVFQNAARWSLLIPLVKDNLIFVERKLGANHPAVATTLNNLGELYRSLGRYEEAETLYNRSIKIYEKALDPNHPSVAATLNNLALLYKSLGRYEKAEPLYNRSIKITEKALGPDHPNVATLLNNLGELYKALERYKEAAPLYKRSLEIQEIALGPDHPDVAVTLNNLGELYRSLGSNKEAEPLYKRSLAIFEKSFGLAHPYMAATLDNLAKLYSALGKHDKAEPLFRRAFEIKEKTLGPDHPDVAVTLNNLGELYRSLGRFKEAEPRYKRSLAIFEKSFGPVHPNIASVFENMAALYEKMGKEKEARECSARAKQIRVKLGQ